MTSASKRRSLNEYISQKIDTKKQTFSFKLLNLEEWGHFSAIAEPDACMKETTENQNEFTRVLYPQLFGTIAHSDLS